MTRRLFAPVLLLSALSFAGCAARVGVGYRSYDPYYHDYHVWTDAEAPHYSAWIAETHHNNVEFGRLSKHDRGDYWRWRHDHP